MNNDDIIDCYLVQSEIEVAKPQQEIGISITAKYDLYFDKSLLGGEQDYFFTVLVSYGDGAEDLTVYDHDIQLFAPDSWMVERITLKSKNICWHISKVDKLNKGENIMVYIKDILCNNVVGVTSVVVSCFALTPTNGEYHSVSETCPLQLSKTFCPVILDFTARNVTKNAYTLEADGFMEFEQFQYLDFVAVNTRPYAVDPPSPPTPPTPIETKEILVSWKTKYAHSLELSYGGHLSVEEGSKQISVPKSLNDIDLTVYSAKKIFLNKKTAHII